MGKKVGKDCSVKLGANTIVYMGTWTIGGVDTDMHETTSFGDDWKVYNFGLHDGGQITFNGFYDPADNTGQMTLVEYNIDNTDISNLKLYVDNTSYFEPCQTTGYASCHAISGHDTQFSHVNITSFEVNADKSGMVNVSFTAKVSGAMVLV